MERHENSKVVIFMIYSMIHKALANTDRGSHTAREEGVKSTCFILYYRSHPTCTMYRVYNKK